MIIIIVIRSSRRSILDCNVANWFHLRHPVKSRRMNEINQQQQACSVITVSFFVFYVFTIEDADMVVEGPGFSIINLLRQTWPCFPNWTLRTLVVVLTSSPARTTSGAIFADSSSLQFFVELSIQAILILPSVFRGCCWWWCQRVALLLNGRQRLRYDRLLLMVYYGIVAWTLWPRWSLLMEYLDGRGHPSMVSCFTSAETHRYCSGLLPVSSTAPSPPVHMMMVSTSIHWCYFILWLGNSIYLLCFFFVVKRMLCYSWRSTAP
jgi:hypothetical protein